MKRSGFKRQLIERVKQPLYRIQRHAQTGSMEMRCAPIEKADEIQHEGYMALVRLLPCAHCFRAPPSQFCHTDEGKGMSIKTDCRLGYPGCGDDLATGRPGCHTLLGMSGKLPREVVRDLADAYAAQTRETIIKLGLWPASLPPFQEQP